MQVEFLDALEVELDEDVALARVVDFGDRGAHLQRQAEAELGPRSGRGRTRTSWHEGELTCPSRVLSMHPLTTLAATSSKGLASCALMMGVET